MLKKITDFIVCVIAIAAIGFCGMAFTAMCYDTAKTEEVEVFSVGCEVSQMVYAEETVSRSSSRPVYKMGVRNDEFAAVLDITDTQFAKYVVGDIVEVEVRVYESGLGTFTYEYKLLGYCDEIYFN